MVTFKIAFSPTRLHVKLNGASMPTTGAGSASTPGIGPYVPVVAPSPVLTDPEPDARPTPKHESPYEKPALNEASAMSTVHGTPLVVPDTLPLANPSNEPPHPDASHGNEFNH